jgi:hypothetical protein
MGEAEMRERGGPEVAFSLLRVLATGYRLWGTDCDVSLAELPRAVRARQADLALAIAQLCDLNLVRLDRHRHTIQLSPEAVQQLIAARETVS